MSQTLTSFGVALTDQLKDVFLALALSETVYRVLDPGGLHQAVRVADELCKGLPHFSDVELKMQWSTSDLAHRYMLGETHDALYVAFMGTKQRRDIVSNARIGMSPLWPNEFSTNQDAPHAHRGFLRRARAVDIHSLYRLASQKGLRLVLCGHSLGGAVAQICTLDLLKSLEDSSEAGRVQISCIGYATPAIGNASLASLVREKGWLSFFINYLLPEDVLGSFFGRHTQPSSADTPAALAGTQIPAGYSALARVAAQKRSSAQQQIWAPKEEPLSLNNIVPCPHPQSGMVFREPLHLGLGPLLTRDLLSGAHGEMSSMSLEMADTNPWLFRNDTHSGPHYTAAAGTARGSVSFSTEAPQRSPVLLNGVRSAETVRESRLNSQKYNWRRGQWLLPGGDMAQRLGSRAALHADSNKGTADLLQALSPASVVVLDDSQEDPFLSSSTSVSSSNSSLSSLDDEEEEATLTAAAEGDRASDILRRARVLASALMLPVSALGSYRPIGRQWRLAKPGQPAGAATTAVIVEKLVSALGDSSATTAEQDPVLVRNVSRLDALQRRLRTICWMHRLPVYRARVREIYDSASDGDPSSGDAPLKKSANQNRAWLADAVAPTMHVESARFITPCGTEFGSSATMPRGQALPRNAAGSTAETRKGLLLVIASLLIAVWLLLWPRVSRGWGWLANLRSMGSHGRHATVFIAVHGQGLQHCSSAALDILGVGALPAVMVQKPKWDAGETSKIQKRGHLSLPVPLQSLARAIDVDDPQLLLLSVQVSQAQLTCLQLENSSSLNLMSNFNRVVAAIDPPTTT
ncbi:hypothetical protein COCOBI_11-1880 [Coccomyxa sp. Obi]|nr:hypothetical protein COCOBI_11-1880 [Coccomyxa sp. Obi]